MRETGMSDDTRGQRIEIKLARLLEPEWTAGRRIEMPVHDLADVSVEDRARRQDLLVRDTGTGKISQPHDSSLRGRTLDIG